jgi:hypothetical protein
MSARAIVPVIAPWIVIIWGFILVLKPNLFVRGIWKRTDIAQQLLSPKGYLIYTRSVGMFFMVAGFLWFVWFALSSTHHPNSPRQTAPNHIASNQSMKPTAPLQYKFSVFATTPCRGLSLSR